MKSRSVWLTSWMEKRFWKCLQVQQLLNVASQSMSQCLVSLRHSLEEWLGIAKKANDEGIGFNAALPSAAQLYIKKIEALVGVECTSVGVGPDRDATIDRVQA